VRQGRTKYKKREYAEGKKGKGPNLSLSRRKGKRKKKRRWERRVDHRTPVCAGKKKDG